MSLAILYTDGLSLWSSKKAPVSIEDLIVFTNKDGDFGELRVVFDTDDWDVQEDGLVYTDKLFLRGLCEFLKTLNVNPADVSYSEQGMQGSNFVSFDVGPDFIGTWREANQPWVQY